MRDAKDAIIARRGRQARNFAKVAAARRLLTLAYYGLRDGQIRCLPEPGAAACLSVPHPGSADAPLTGPARP